MTDSADAAAALDAIRASRMRLIEASDAPPSRHAAFAGLIGAMIAAPVLPLPLRIAAFVLIMGGVGLVVQWDRRRTGMFINGYRRGRTRWVTAAVLITCLALYGFSTWLAVERHLTWPSLALAAVGMVASYGASHYWCRVFRQEMAEL